MQPYICPVCSGNGLVMNGFYNQVSGQWSTGDCKFEECRTCKGTGIIWSEDEESPMTPSDDDIDPNPNIQVGESDFTG